MFNNTVAKIFAKGAIQQCCARASAVASYQYRYQSSEIPDRDLKLTPKSEITHIELPRKGKIAVPKHIREVGDAIVSLNMLESLVLGEYIREKLGLDKDTPDPLTAMLETHQFAALTGFPALGGGGGGMPQMTPQMMAAMQAAAGAQAAAPAAEAAAPKEEKKEEKKPEKSIYNIKLEKFDADKKINLIKELRKIDSKLSIKDAKDLVEGAPSTLKKDVPKEEAEKIKKELEANGATIALE